jgi:hypothetical protein
LWFEWILPVTGGILRKKIKNEENIYNTPIAFWWLHHTERPNGNPFATKTSAGAPTANGKRFRKRKYSKTD